MKRVGFAFGALLALACGGSDSAVDTPVRKPLGGEATQQANQRNQAPILDGVAMSTRSPVAGVPIEARFEASDPEGAALTYDVAWLLNDTLLQSGQLRGWTPGKLEKGDRIELRVTVTDGELSAGPITATAIVGNQSPTFERIVLEPSENPTRADVLTATPLATDADGDEVDFAFEWILNGETARAQRSARFDLAEARRGDRIRVRVRASDGESPEVLADSAEVTVGNAAPRMERFAGFEAVDDGFRHQLKATDPDGDRGLRFVLAEGPRGMQVDPLLGLITWKPDGSVTGKVPVQIEVQDPLGASSALRFELTVGGATGGGAKAATPANAPESD